MPTFPTSKKRQKRRKKEPTEQRRAKKTAPNKEESVEVLLSEEKIRARIAELAGDISRKYEGRDLILIGVLKGAFIFLADLARQIELPLTCDFLRVSSYGDDTRSSGIVRFEFDHTQPIADKDVLIVEDIIDTGRTAKALMDVLGPRNPRSLEICTLLHKPSRSEVEVPIAFHGFTIPNEFVVGYGLDYAGRYRNLPYIGVLKQ